MSKVVNVAVAVIHFNNQYLLGFRHASQRTVHDLQAKLMAGNTIHIGFGLLLGLRKIEPSLRLNAHLTIA